ncbi:hypothetical protein [Mucilaginibacter pocheonensis]|uniref:CarboxypepD_reg-like domain-containing protein n=1 Tax=Mucilaginibacter pocheonensis TaxID=398050 RepID=A0ABU1TJY0_9SPHI|nr:hypothetical protein [Mucilaginibacter pocheonensis]MDR6945121.1 hypothetical protein [Mucilaginibacter pocheonensis]
MTINLKSLTIILSLFMPVLFESTVFAQGNLMKEVSIGEIKQQRMGSVLDKIASKGDFYFAYNNKTIPADSIVSISGYRGTLFSLLDKLLGESYEFKEVPGYIVLRHAPGKLYITVEVDKDPGKQTVIKGYVKDVLTQKELTQASVYEKNLLISTLTDDRGYFELKLKNWNGSLLISVTKENYRDTSLYVLPVVNVDARHNNRKYKYYPDEGSENGVEHSRFARFFISSKQLIQGMNLGNFFASNPYQISLTPGLSSQGMYNSQVIDHFSLNLLGGYTAGIKGFEAAGLFNINRKNVSFFQVAGIFNVVGGSVSGFQAAGIYNHVLNNSTGVQIGGVLNKTNHFTGALQAAGVANIDEQASGLQIAGVINSVDNFNGGVQIAGVFNNVESFNGGVQIAGVFNAGQKSKGFQLAGLFNWSTEQSGAQFATLFNVSKKVKKFQFGLVNVADSSDYPIGIINFIKNGEKSFSLSTDETLLTHLDYRSGGRVLYGLIGAGYKFDNNTQAKYALNVGFGAHVVNSRRFSLNGEYVEQMITDLKKKFYQISSFRVLPGYKLNKLLVIYAGPTFNITSADVSDDAKINGWILNRHISNNKMTALNFGITGGLQFVW